MAETTAPNVAQFQAPVLTRHVQDAEIRVALTGVAATTTQLTVQQLIADVTPPASGTQTWKLPTLDQWKNKLAVFYQSASAPGGESKFVLGEDGTTDVVGDNMTAQNDKVVLFNAQGEKVIVVTETTT